MKTKHNNAYRNVLRILGTIAALGYILFLIDFGVPHFKELNFADTSIYLLFAVFMLGYMFLWKNELISGILIVLWYALEWCLVLWVWVDGDMVIVLGFPIFIIGILVLFYGIRHKAHSNPVDNSAIE